MRQEGVRLVADIEDPVGHGELERKTVTDVRGGGYIPLMFDLKDMS